MIEADTKEVIALKVPWGYFEMKPFGLVEWHPNENLEMSPEKQFSQNEKNGRFKGVRLVGEYT